MKNLLASIHFNKYPYIIPHLICVQRAYEQLGDSFSYAFIDDGPDMDETMKRIDRFKERTFPIHYIYANRRLPGEEIYLCEAELDNFLFMSDFSSEFDIILKTDAEILFKPEVMQEVLDFCKTCDTGGMHVHTANLSTESMSVTKDLIRLPDNYDKIYDLISERKSGTADGRYPDPSVSGLAFLPPTKNPNNLQFHSIAFFGMKRSIYNATGGMPKRHKGYGIFDGEFLTRIRAEGFTFDVLNTEYYTIQLPHPWSSMDNYVTDFDREVKNPIYKFLG